MKKLTISGPSVKQEKPHVNRAWQLDPQNTTYSDEKQLHLFFARI